MSKSKIILILVAILALILGALGYRWARSAEF